MSSTTKLNFTKRSLEALPSKAARYNVFDSQARGLGVVVHPSGRKTFFWLRKGDGRPMRETLGTFPDLTIENARDGAEERNHKLADWKKDKFESDSPFEKPDSERTLNDVFEAYVARHLRVQAKNPDRAVSAAKWLYERFPKSLRNRRAAHVRRPHVSALHGEVYAESGGYLANRVVQLLRAILRYGIGEELFKGRDPVAGFNFAPETKRTRYLQPEEMFGFFKTLRDEENRDLSDFVWLALTTGVRRGDLLSAQWKDINLASATWAIPNPKNQEPYVIPLMAEAVKILKLRREIRPGDWIFPSDGKSGHLVEIKRAWQGFRKRAGVPDLRIHDLRRTFGSWQAALNTSLPIIGKSLGHASTQATQVYARLDLDPVRASVTAATAAMIAAGKKKPKLLKAAARA